MLLIMLSSMAHAQRTVRLFDFESPLDLKNWWVDNKDVTLSACDRKECEQVPGSGKCLRIEWGRVPEDRPYTWLTDIKIDTFGSGAMEHAWSGFKENAWLSFKVNTADADSVYFQFVIFTKDEKDKWGSRDAIGFRSAAWKTIKVRLSSLVFDNWGKGAIAAPDFGSMVPARIEIGIRTPRDSKAARIDLRIDDILITDYEP
jgi:hypothetical protein